MLRAVPGLMLAALLAPIGAGLGGTLLCAFGWMPALGGTALSWQPWTDLFATPGIGHAVRLTLATGLAATLIALALASATCALMFDTKPYRILQASLGPVLATPHAALAIGFSFLIAPSGWLVRLLSPWATGFDRPPDWTVVHDPYGLALTAGLVLKEAPFLLLMSLSALGQIEATGLLRAAGSLGYGRASAWWSAVFPLLYRQLRIPVYAVLAFSLSVVDVAIVLGPSNPPTLGVLVLRGFTDPDLSRWFVAAAGAMLLLAIVSGAIVSWRLGEAAVWALMRAAIRGGRLRQGRVFTAALRFGTAGMGVGLLAGMLSMVLLVIWSVAGLWRFPDVWPQRWTGAAWGLGAGGTLPIVGPAAATVAIAGLATAIAVAAASLWLEAMDRGSERGSGWGGGRGARRALGLIYVPLLLPQLGFLFGVQIGLDRLALDGTLAAVVGVHLLFVLPYVFLSLADPWRARDVRYGRAAASLGAGPWRVFRTVKLPLLRRPLLIAAAVGVAVSAGLYLPTVFAGAGRVATLTTEAVTLSGSGDRRVLGVYATLQAAIPALGFALAMLVPARPARCGGRAR